MEQQQLSVETTNESILKRNAEQILEALVVKHRIIEDRGRPKRTLSYISKSHAFSNAITKNRISCGHNFFFPLEKAIKTTAFVKDGPSIKADENTTHHPYFLRETKKLIDSAESANIMIHQRVFWTKSGHWLKLDDGISAGVEPDFCTTDLIAGDPLVAAPSEGVKLPPSKYDVAIAFEQKKSFVGSDQMEIVDYGERILCIQRGREVAFTALFHCSGGDKTIRWAKTEEVNGEFITRISKPASLEPYQDGQRQLLTMLTKTSAELGRNFPNYDQTECSQKLTILYRVGEGATSTVYFAKLGGTEGVVKVMKKGFEYLADHEMQILDHLQRESVPGLLSSTKVTDGVLFFNKLLRPFTGTFTVDQVTHLLDCLEQAHLAGVVHRDVRPENVMEDGQGKVYLIDWGFARTTESDSCPPEFEGTFRFASERALAAVIDGSPRHPLPQDDLESLVKTVAAVNSGGRRIWRKLSEIGQGNFHAAKIAWDEELQLHVTLRSMCEAAASSNYQELKNMIY